MRKILAIMLYPFTLIGVTAGVWAANSNKNVIVYRNVAEQAWYMAYRATAPFKNEV